MIEQFLQIHLLQVISIHVFNLLFLRLETKKLAGIFMTIAVWCSVCAIDLFGPAVLVKHDLGPFFGIAGRYTVLSLAEVNGSNLSFVGYWCWITDKYPGARIGLEYFWVCLQNAYYGFFRSI